MNALKQYLKGEVHSIDPSIVATLKKYKTIKVGSVVYDTKEIIDKIQQQGCSHCKAYKAELESLRYQLKQLNAPAAPCSIGARRMGENDKPGRLPCTPSPVRSPRR